MATAYAFINTEPDVVWHIVLLHLDDCLKRILQQASAL